MSASARPAAPALAASGWLAASSSARLFRVARDAYVSRADRAAAALELEARGFGRVFAL